MYHYTVTVSTGKDAFTDKKIIIDRLDYYNGSSSYLLFDGGNDTEKRFILISEKKLTKTALTDLNGIFEATVKAEEISYTAISSKIINKINVAKSLMVNNSYRGEQKSLLITDTPCQILGKINSMIGYSKFKDFCKFLSDYIETTASMGAKAKYNIVIVNKACVNLDEHIELLCGLFASKGILIEQALITGDIHDATHTDKDTGCVYFIQDEWDAEKQGEFYSATDCIELLNKIKRSNNVYITAMTPDEYDILSTLDIFNICFPHVVEIEELSIDEKAEYITKVAAEYGFTINAEVFEYQFIECPLDSIEAIIRKTVKNKLMAKTDNFCLEIDDFIETLETDAKKNTKKKISAFDELEQLIGLDNVKVCIKEIATFLKRRGILAVPCLHMCFRGNPGTGKTSVARILARIFSELGITKRSLLVETDRSGLVGGYVGQTALKTARVVESAIGGVLFIDEAYSLLTDGDKIDYGHEAVSTLVKLMEDKRNEFVCIFAGYTKEMNDMLNMNPGLRDRIQFYIDFEDYSETQLLQIFEKLCKENKYKLDKDARGYLLDKFSLLIKNKGDNFSNGRLVRKVFERVRIKQALRTSKNTITEADIKAVFTEADIAALFGGNNHTQIGFRH